MAGLRLAILGSLRVTGEAGAYPVTATQLVRLLGYLAVHAPDGRALSRDTVVEALYPELPQAVGRRTLSDTLYRLRNVLGSDAECVVSSERIVALHNTVVDVRLFRRHATARTLDDGLTALELYQGEMLEQLDDDWVLGQRALMHDLLLHTLAQVCTLLVEQGQASDALMYARRWVEADPFNETAHRMVMRLYVQSGRGAAALQQYRQLVTLLDTELQVSPLPETQALAEAIAFERFEQPASAKSSLHVLVNSLTDDQKQQLELLALLGHATTAQVLHAVLTVEPESALQSLIQRGFVAVREERYSFTEAGLRGVLLNGLISTRLHRPLQQVVAALHRTVHGAPPPLQVRLARRQAPDERRQRERILVSWTVDAGEDDQRILASQGKVALRRHRLRRLLEEAEVQGAVPTTQELAAALGSSLRTIEADLAALRRP